MATSSKKDALPSGKNHSESFSLAFNDTSREYVFAPVSYDVKLAIFVTMACLGVYGCITNLLVLFFKQKQYKRRRHMRRKAFKRSLTEFFINSLVLSNILCSVISIPTFASELFINFVQNDWVCKVNRFLNIIFPVITILNLLVIGLERYFCIFYPFSVLSRRKAKKMVVAAWFFGVLITLLPIPTYRLVHFDIGEQFYTLVCKYDKTVPLYRGLFICFTFVIYIVPSFILVFINIRILTFLRRTRRVGPQQNSTSPRPRTSRFKVTRMFVSLIFAFIIPYLLFIVYNGLMMILKPKVSFTTDYLARYASALLSYANGAVSATILFYNDGYLRKMVVGMLWSAVSACWPSHIASDTQLEDSNPELNSVGDGRRQINSDKILSTKAVFRLECLTEVQQHTTLNN